MARRAARAALILVAARAVSAEEGATPTGSLRGSSAPAGALAECQKLSTDPMAPDQCPSAGNVNPTLKCFYDPSCFNTPPEGGGVGCVERTGCRYVNSGPGTYQPPIPAPAPDATPAPTCHTPAPTTPGATPAPDATPAPTSAEYASPAPTSAATTEPTPAPATETTTTETTVTTTTETTTTETTTTETTTTETTTTETTVTTTTETTTTETTTTETTETTTTETTTTETTVTTTTETTTTETSVTTTTETTAVVSPPATPAPATDATPAPTSAATPAPTCHTETTTTETTETTTTETTTTETSVTTTTETTAAVSPPATPAPATDATPAPTATPAATRAPSPAGAPAPTPAATLAAIPTVGLNGNWNNLARAWSTDVVYASRICVRSVGGFLMTFDIWDTESNFVSTSPILFPSPTTGCVDISEIPGVREGSPVSPRIFILGYSDGRVRTAIQSVIYAREADAAQYTCLGSTSSFYCNLETRGEPLTLDEPIVGEAVGDANSEAIGAVGDAVGEAIGDKISGRGLGDGRSHESQFNGAFSRFAAPWTTSTVYASEVCIRNSAGYGLRFKLWDTHTNLVSDFTGDYSAGFTNCLQVAVLFGAQRGHPISPRVYVLGYQDSMVQVAQQSIIYDPRAGRADYTCRGSVGGWWCDRVTGALLL